MLLCGAAQNGFAGSKSEAGGLQMAVNEVQLHSAALGNLLAVPQIRFRSRKMRCPAAPRGAGKQSTGNKFLCTRFPQAINRLIEPFNRPAVCFNHAANRFNHSADRLKHTADRVNGSADRFNRSADSFNGSAGRLNAGQVRCKAGNSRKASLRNCFLQGGAAQREFIQGNI